jgi:prophage regulatory protein
MTINHSETKQPDLTFLRINQVITTTGVSRSYIYQLSKSGLFPKAVSLVPGGTSVAWVASEVDAWINERIAERDQEA